MSASSSTLTHIIETIQPNLKEKYSPTEALDSQCVIQLSDLSLQSADEYAMITVQNMYFPLVFFAVCALIGIILQCIYMFSSNKSSLIGRVSQLDLTTTGTASKKDRYLMRRRSRMKSRDDNQDDERFSNNGFGEDNNEEDSTVE